MSAENKNIDQLFKEKLATQNFEVPASFLSDLESQLDTLAPAKKKKRAIYWWFLSIVPLFFLAYFSYATYYDAPSKEDAKTQQSSKTNIENSSSKLLSKKDNNNVATSDYATLHKEKNNSDPMLATDTNANNFENASNDISANNFKSNPTENNISLKDNAIKKSKKHTQTTGYSNLHGIGSKNPKSTANAPKTGIDIAILKNNKDDNNDLKDDDIAIQIIRSDSNSIDQSSISSDDLAADNITSIESKTYIDTIKKIIFIDSVVLRDSVILVYDTTFLDSSHLTAYKKITVESQLLIGTGLVKSLGTPNLMTDLDLLSKSKIRTFDIGFDLNFYWKKVSLSTGFSRYNWGDYFSYSYTTINNHDSVFIDHYDEYITIDSNTNVLDTIYVPILDTLVISDTVNNGNTFIAYYNRLSIPLKFGYKFDYKTWSIIPRVGLNFEIRSQKQADGIYLPGNFQNNIPARTSISYLLQVEIRKNFNKRYVYMSPFYRKTAYSLFDDNIGVGKYEVYGLHFGLGSKF